MTQPSLPPSLPLSTLTQTRRFFLDPFDFVEEATERCGDIFSARLLGFGTWVFVGSPPLVREFFKAPVDTLVAGEINRTQLGFLLGLDASFSLDGDEHLVRHRVVHPQLNGRRTHRYIPMMRDITRRALENWPEGKPFALLPQAHRISLDVLTQAMFGDIGRDRLDRLADLFEQFAVKVLRSPLVAMPFLQVDLGRFSPWGRALRLQRAVKAAYGEEIQRRLDSTPEEMAVEDTECILDAFIHTEQRGGGRLGFQSLLDEVLILTFAGHETTATILTWSLECMLSRPQVLEGVLTELREVLGDRPIEAEDLGKLPYLDAVIQESIRYRPIAPMAGIRLVKKPYAIGDHLLPEGTTVVQCFPAMTRRPELFANPDVFDTDHFYQRKFKPFEWNPFGGGTRMCIGKGLAEVELKVVIATLLQHAQVELRQDKVVPRRHGFFFGPSKGLRIAVRKNR